MLALETPVSSGHVRLEGISSEVPFMSIRQPDYCDISYLKVDTIISIKKKKLVEGKRFDFE